MGCFSRYTETICSHVLGILSMAPTSPPGKKKSAKNWAKKTRTMQIAEGFRRSDVHNLVLTYGLGFTTEAVKNVRLGCVFSMFKFTRVQGVFFSSKKGIWRFLTQKKTLVLSNEVGPFCTDLLSFALDMSQLLDILRQRWWQQGTTGNTKRKWP